MLPDRPAGGDGNGAPPRYLLRLYVTGNTPRSLRAVINARALCEERLAGRYELEVVDIHREPERAREARIVVAPTLVRELPWPPQRIIGDLLSDREGLIFALGLPAERPAAPAEGGGAAGGEAR